MTDTDLAPALVDALARPVAPLGEYDGEKVIKTSIALRKAGDGLSKTMAIAPKIYKQRKKVYVLVECEVGPHKFVPIPETDCVELKQDFIAGTATVVDAAFAKEKIDAQAAEIQRAKDEATGQQSSTTEFESQHKKGEHAEGLIDGCPLCDEEKRRGQEEGDPLYGDPDEG